MDDVELVKVADAIRALAPAPTWRGGYPDRLGLCVLDAVYSVNADYERDVRPKMQSYRAIHVGDGRFDVADLREAIERAGGPPGFAGLFRSRQRTSTRNGILKADAADRVAAALLALDSPINDRDDLDAAAESGMLADLDAAAESGMLADGEAAWRSVKGQVSGVTWRYFLMLAGVDGVKPDRMILRFLRGVIDRTVTPAEAAELVTAAASRAGLTATEADHLIWQNTRTRPQASSRTR